MKLKRHMLCMCMKQLKQKIQFRYNSVFTSFNITGFKEVHNEVVLLHSVSWCFSFFSMSSKQSIWRYGTSLQLVPNRPNHIPLLSTNRGEQLSLPRQDRCGEERDHLEQRDGGHTLSFYSLRLRSKMTPMNARCRVGKSENSTLSSTHYIYGAKSTFLEWILNDPWLTFLCRPFALLFPWASQYNFMEKGAC